MGESVHPVTIGEWIAGKSSPTGENLMTLAKALQTAPEYLLYGQESKPSMITEPPPVYVISYAEAGVSMKAVQTLLGHSDIKTTLEIYTHVSDDYLKKAVNRLYSNFTLSKRNNEEQWGIMGNNEQSGVNRPKPLRNQLITSD